MAEYQIDLIRGRTFRRSFHYKDPAGADISFAGKVLKFGCRPDNYTASVFTMLSSDSTTANGSFIHYTDQPGGEFDLKISDEQAALLDFETGTWWIDITASGDADPLINGILTVSNP